MDDVFLPLSVYLVKKIKTYCMPACLPAGSFMSAWVERHCHVMSLKEFENRLERQLGTHEPRVRDPRRRCMHVDRIVKSPSPNERRWREGEERKDLGWKRTFRALPNATTHEFLIGLFAVIRRSPKDVGVTRNRGRSRLSLSGIRHATQKTRLTFVCSPTFKMTKSIVCPAGSIAPFPGERPAALTNTR